MKQSLSTLLATTEIASMANYHMCSPQEAYDIATKIVQREPDLLLEIIVWRWEMELRRGIVNFDPRNPGAYKQVKIGDYMKRIIPDRIQPTTEKFSDPYVPVFLPFKEKYPSNFDFTLAKPGQKLLSILVGNKWLDVYASNSPLAQVPHTLLVPRELRSQFLLPVDLETVSILQERYPMFHFIYSSMGAGAGVNHQHWHMMAGECDYPVLTRPITFFHKGKNVSFGHYPKWPTDCLVIEKYDNCKMDIEIKFIKFLQEKNIPHNLFVWNTRTWVTPRSHESTVLIPGKKYGAWETILGICNTGSQVQYDFVDENILEQALREIQLESDIKKEIVQKLKSLV